MTYYSELVKVIINGKERYIRGYLWEHYVSCSDFNNENYTDFSEELGLFIDMPYLDKKELLVLISLNDLKDKKPGDIIVQKRFEENLIFSFYSHCILCPKGLFGDFFNLYIKPLYQTIDPKEFPYFKIDVTLRSAELSFKTIKNELYKIGNNVGPEFITKTNDLLNKDRNDYIVKYFLAHFKEDDYLKKEFFKTKYIIELYKVLESDPIRFNHKESPWIRPPKDSYSDIQKLKKKIENDFKDSLIYKAIRSYNFNLK
jgi:hypothetical protein